MSRVAAIDCGTNSIRLLIADITGDNFKEVLRTMEIVRLGQGVDQNKAFHPDAIDRTLSAVRLFKDHIASKGVEKIPQREILNRYGYKLICSDVSQEKHPNLFYEDWWVNGKYFDEDKIKPWISDKLSCDKIFNKMGIKYIINKESETW